MPREEMEALKREVTEMTTVSASAAALISGLKSQLDTAIADADWDAVEEMRDSLDEAGNDLAAAVAANTPASTENPPVEGGGETPTTPPPGV